MAKVVARNVSKAVSAEVTTYAAPSGSSYTKAVSVSLTVCDVVPTWLGLIGSGTDAGTGSRICLESPIGDYQARASFKFTRDSTDLAFHKMQTHAFQLSGKSIKIMSVPVGVLWHIDEPGAPGTYTYSLMGGEAYGTVTISHFKLVAFEFG